MSGIDENDSPLILYSSLNHNLKDGHLSKSGITISVLENK